MTYLPGFHNFLITLLWSFFIVKIKIHLQPDITDNIINIVIEKFNFEYIYKALLELKWALFRDKLSLLFQIVLHPVLLYWLAPNVLYYYYYT